MACSSRLVKAPNPYRSNQIFPTINRDINTGSGRVLTQSGCWHITKPLKTVSAWSFLNWNSGIMWLKNNPIICWPVGDWVRLWPAYSRYVSHDLVHPRIWILFQVSVHFTFRVFDKQQRCQRNDRRKTIHPNITLWPPPRWCRWLRCATQMRWPGEWLKTAHIPNLTDLRKNYVVVTGITHDQSNNNRLSHYRGGSSRTMDIK